LKSLIKDGVRGKYAQTYGQETTSCFWNRICQAFPDEKAVNEALRLVMKLTKVQKECPASAAIVRLCVVR